MEELYDIRITRNPSRQRGETGGIATDEWLAVVHSDPSLEPIDHVVGRNPATGEAMRVDLPYAASWHQTPGERGTVFRFENGEIISPWAGEDAQAKARQIASVLKAHLLLQVD
jgi:hypothetical protein